MKKLNNPWFLACLAILILNDFVLKAEFGNWFTGKLSDFVGLFVFPFFWSVLFPKRTKLIHCLTFVAFIFWKSSWSQPMIDGINTLGFSLSRVVDCSDFIALPVVLISYWYLQKKKNFTLKFSPVLTICMACFAFFSTTQPRYFYAEDINKTYAFDYSIYELTKRVNKIAYEKNDTTLICNDTIKRTCYNPEEQCFYQRLSKETYDSINKKFNYIYDKELTLVGCIIQKSDIESMDSVQIKSVLGEAYIKGDSIKSYLYIKSFGTQSSNKVRSKNKRIKLVTETFETWFLPQLQKPLE